MNKKGEIFIHIVLTEPLQSILSVLRDPQIPYN